MVAGWGEGGGRWHLLKQHFTGIGGSVGVWRDEGRGQRRQGYLPLTTLVKNLKSTFQLRQLNETNAAIHANILGGRDLRQYSDPSRPISQLSFVVFFIIIIPLGC